MEDIHGGGTRNGIHGKSRVLNFQNAFLGCFGIDDMGV